MKRTSFLLTTLLGAGVLSACTGTEETPPPLRLALLLRGGERLAYVDTTPPTGQTLTNFTPTLTGEQDVAGGRMLHTVGGGQTALLTRQGAVEQRDPLLNVVSTFAAPSFDPCFVRSALNPARTRLLVLSQCNDAVQRLALYNVDGTVIWTASLGTAPVPLSETDAPPVRLAVVGDVGVVTRPALNGGSEVIRAAPRLSGDPLQDITAVTTAPERTVALRDLALFGTTIYAATDNGIYPLLDTGLPDLTKRVAAFGEGRFDRLWGASIGTRNLLLGWRDGTNSVSTDQNLRLWDGVAATTQNVGYVTELRDLVLPPDGNLYVLTRTTVTRYDAILGLQSGNWSPRLVLSGLNDARSLTWLVPTVTSR